jgi:hypothetical protein
LLKRRRVKNPTLQKTDFLKKTSKKRSKWTLLFHKTYPGLKFNKDAISRRTGIPKKTLNTVYDRGLKAWKTGGSRPGATAQQWAIARMYKYVLVTKKKAQTTRFDPDYNLRHSQKSTFGNICSRESRRNQVPFSKSKQAYNCRHSTTQN